MQNHLFWFLSMKQGGLWHQVKDGYCSHPEWNASKQNGKALLWTLNSQKMHLPWNSMNSLLQKNTFIISLPSYVTYLWVLLYNDEIFLTLLLNLEDDVVMSDDWWPTFLCLTESWAEWHTSYLITYIALLMLLHSFHQRSKIVEFHFFFEHSFYLYIFLTADELL